MTPDQGSQHDHNLWCKVPQYPNETMICDTKDLNIPQCDHDLWYKGPQFTQIGGQSPLMPPTSPK